MYIARVKTARRYHPYFYLRDSDDTILLALGHTRSVERAYSEALKDYLKASARLQAFEAILPRFAQEAPQRG